KANEYKQIINELVPTNIDGTFKIHITVDNHNIDKFLNICKVNNLKVVCIYLNDDVSIQQLMTSSYHVGTYPAIIELMRTLIDNLFNEIHIRRMKIISLILNNGVPENDIDKLLLWDKKSNYFEFHYKLKVTSESRLHKLKDLCREQNLHLVSKSPEKPLTKKVHYIVTMRLFNCGRRNAWTRNDFISRHLHQRRFYPLRVKEQFVVYDSNIALDNPWSTADVTRTAGGPKYRIGGKYRKVPPRSSV
ncbi:unnamed protein product, partial [Rotaria sp. Silwood2]